MRPNMCSSTTTATSRAEAEHFHIYFGNDGFDALMSAKTNPFFVKDALSAEDILDELMGHDHGEEKLTSTSGCP